MTSTGVDNVASSQIWLQIRYTVRLRLRLRVDLVLKCQIWHWHWGCLLQCSLSAVGSDRMSMMGMLDGWLGSASRVGLQRTSSSAVQMVGSTSHQHPLKFMGRASSQGSDWGMTDLWNPLCGLWVKLNHPH